MKICWVNHPPAIQKRVNRVSIIQITDHLYFSPFAYVKAIPVYFETTRMEPNFYFPMMICGWGSFYSAKKGREMFGK
jgi:hypothetical protein